MCFMKNDNKIPLSLLRDRLQDILHYDRPDDAFNQLLAAWRHYAHKSWYTGAKGWLAVDDAKAFSDYVGYELTRDLSNDCPHDR